MKWFFRWMRRLPQPDHEVSIEMKQNVDESLLKADRALKDTQAKLPEIARAASSAKKVQYRVDRFTAELESTFRRINHG